MPQVMVLPGNGNDRPLWAVAPLRNESGTSGVDALAVSDALVAKAGEIRGVSCVPMNRTLAAMRALRMSEVRSAADARQLAGALGADAILVGSITAYDPYDPPKIGLAVALFARSQPTRTMADDHRELRTATTDTHAGGGTSDQPVWVATPYLDAANHEVLMHLKDYATGRHDANTSLGWKRYVMSMDLYTEFAAYWALHEMLHEEQERLSATTGTPPQETSR